MSTGFQRVTMDWGRTRSSYMHGRSQHASLTVEAPSGIWGAEASYSSFSSDRQTSNSEVLVVESVVSLDAERPTFTLTEHGRAMAARGPEHFRRACGDAFVSSVLRGSRFFAVASVTSQQREQALGRSVAANAHYASVTVNASFRDQRSHSMQQGRIQFRQERQGRLQLFSGTIREMIDDALDLPGTTNASNSVVVGFRISDYSAQLAEIGATECAIDLEASAVTTAYRDATERIAAASLVLERLRTPVSASCPNTDRQLRQYQEAGLARLRELRAVYRACIQNNDEICSLPVPTGGSATAFESMPVPSAAECECQGFPRDAEGFCTRCQARFGREPRPYGAVLDLSCAIRPRSQFQYAYQLSIQSPSGTPWELLVDAGESGRVSTQGVGSSSPSGRVENAGGSVADADGLARVVVTPNSPGMHVGAALLICTQAPCTLPQPW